MNSFIIAEATHYGAQCTPRKARLLRPMIVGKTVAHALAVLGAERRAGAVDTIKVIKSAFDQLDAAARESAVISEFIVNEGPKRKTYMPRAQGRASNIIKRTSHLTILIES